MIEIRQLELGPLANFVYIVADQASGSALVIDPCWDVNAIRDVLKKEKWNLKAIVLTHHHFDHIGGLGEILKLTEVPVYIHKDDAPAIEKDFARHLKEVDEGDIFKFGSLEASFLHTPGHTEGSLCLQVERNLFTGDTLFIGGCGRVDLPNSDPKKMYSSLKKIASLADTTLIYPGHNYGGKKLSLLGEEKGENPYLSLALKGTFEQFLRVIA